MQEHLCSLPVLSSDAESTYLSPLQSCYPFASHSAIYGKAVALL
jgi:hypothetical protein